MSVSIAEIALALGVQPLGNAALSVDRPAEPATASKRELALAMSSKYAAALSLTRARAAIVWAGCDWQSFGLEAAICVEGAQARLALTAVTSAFAVPLAQNGIHPTAIVGRGAKIADNVSIGPFTVIGDGVRIGQGSWIGAHVTLADGTYVGPRCVLHDGVRIGPRVTLDDNCIIHPNAVIGADGFSYATAEVPNEERAIRNIGKGPLDPPDSAIRHKVHSLGGVTIGAQVEIGANSTVDAGTIRPTRIGRGTKIDNLVQVGHNVVIGEDCVLSAQAAIAGSAVLGDRVVMGGKSGIKDNVTIGRDVVLGGGAIVLGSVDDGQFMMGHPAVPMPIYRAHQKALRRLAVPKSE